MQQTERSTAAPVASFRAASFGGDDLLSGGTSSGAGGGTTDSTGTASQQQDVILRMETASAAETKAWPQVACECDSTMQKGSCRGLLVSAPAGQMGNRPCCTLCCVKYDAVRAACWRGFHLPCTIAPISLSYCTACVSTLAISRYLSTSLRYVWVSVRRSPQAWSPSSLC